jgi:PAS domain S-box-containing protein
MEKKIMIVEDEVIVGMDLKTKVQNLGYIVDSNVIRYGEEVAAAAKKVKPDLILMDIRLKGEMTGTEAAAIVREKMGIPIIFLTAYSDSDTLSKAKQADPYAYLKKPVRVDDLRLSIEFTLHKAELEKKLKLSELQYRTVADYTYDWETWIGPDGKYIYISPSCERITGYKKDQFLDDPSFFYSIVHPDDREAIQNDFRTHLSSTKDTCCSEFRIISSDGETRWMEHFCCPVFSTEGDYIGRRAGNRDVTERKKLSTELKEKVSELEAALDNIKTLKGLIPICASCKKIRDDKGYWNMLEAYIQSHSEATFSHSMCPECMEQFYGDEDWYKAMKEKNKL